MTNGKGDDGESAAGNTATRSPRGAGPSSGRITLSAAHVEATNRRRRIIFQDDVLANDRGSSTPRLTS